MVVMCIIPTIARTLLSLVIADLEVNQILHRLHVLLHAGLPIIPGAGLLTLAASFPSPANP